MELSAFEAWIISEKIHQKNSMPRDMENNKLVKNKSDSQEGSQNEDEEQTGRT